LARFATTASKSIGKRSRGKWKMKPIVEMEKVRDAEIYVTAQIVKNIKLIL
jgi:hypothetical protein